MTDHPVRVGVDTGGTFTDAVFPYGTIRKVLSTSSDPAAAVSNVLSVLAPDSGAMGPESGART
ncbi:MAG: hypothetical protein JO087_03615, partial [Actinobacteria bacterium]|nr:hypothetical protein [Actinomycetota bacterium]